MKGGCIRSLCAPNFKLFLTPKEDLLSANYKLNFQHVYVLYILVKYDYINII